MSKINLEGFKQICDSVWRDRGALLFWRGPLSGEDALMRAVYWRLCKEGFVQDKSAADCHQDPALPTYQLVLNTMLKQSAQMPHDCASSLNELVLRYRDEAGAELSGVVKAESTVGVLKI